MLRAILSLVLLMSAITLLIAGIFHGTLPLYSKCLWGAGASVLGFVLSIAFKDEIEGALKWERRIR